MPTTRYSIPFSISILTLMALIVVPLSSALLWLGWRAVNTLEQRSVDQRMTALDDAVASFLSNGLRTIMSVGHTLAEEPDFSSAAGPSADAERLRQLAALLKRHPTVAATFVGYPDGHFDYAGKLSSFSAEERKRFDAPAGEGVIVRTIDGQGGDRRESWQFVLPDGGLTSMRSRPDTFDPRERPWYRDVADKKAPILTVPYHFAWSNEPGITVGVPLPSGGAIGFDFTLGTLARLIGDYKITPNAIVVLEAGAPDVLIESEACPPAHEGCFSTGDAALQALRKIVAQAGGQRLEREAEFDGRAYKLIVNPMPELFDRPFAIGVAVPVEELSAASRVLLERAAFLAAIAIGLAILAVLVTSILMSRSMSRLAAKTARIRDLDFSDTTPVRSHVTEILRLSDAVERMREGLQIFGRYVSRDLVVQIMRSPERAGLGGARRELTVMFTDIEGFSRLSEDIEPELLTSRLSRYFEALGAAISSNHGMIDKYIGDSIMAFWNAPEPDPDHIAHACNAALQAAEASRKLAEKWRERGRPGFRTRIGLHTGPAVVGNVGARERINYTLVGAVANQASRLEGLNKVYGTDILASGEVAAATSKHFVWRHIDRIVAAGTTEVMEIYEPLGLADGAATHEAFLDRWRQGHSAYYEGRFDAALEGFRAAQALRPHDAPCRVFIARCTELVEKGMPSDWDGAWHFDKK